VAISACGADMKPEVSVAAGKDWESQIIFQEQGEDIRPGSRGIGSLLRP